MSAIEGELREFHGNFPGSISFKSGVKLGNHISLPLHLNRRELDATESNCVSD